jgi:hypothetical protein
LDEWIDSYCLDADVFVLVANAESTLMLTVSELLFQFVSYTNIELKVFICWFQETLCLCAQFELVTYDHRITILMIFVTAVLRLWKEVSWFDAVHICFKLLLFTWMLIVVLASNKWCKLVDIGQKRCKDHE